MKKEIEIPMAGFEVDIIELSHEIGGCKSKSEGKRLLKQGAIEVDGEMVIGRCIKVKDGSILHIGRSFWRKIKMPMIKVTVDIQHSDDEDIVKVLDIKTE